MSDPKSCLNCGKLLPNDAVADHCEECDAAQNASDSMDGVGQGKSFRIGRFDFVLILLWLAGVTLLYFCSWPPYQFRMPEDRIVVAIGEDGRYLATVESPVKLIKEFSGGVKPGGRLQPRGPIEVWDVRSGSVVHRIDCGAVMVDSVHVMDQGRLVTATCSDEPSSPATYESFVDRRESGNSQPAVKSYPGKVVHCHFDPSGSAIAVLKQTSGALVSTVSLINLQSGKRLSQLAEMNLLKLCFSQDGSLMGVVERFAEEGHRVQVVDLTTGEQIAAIHEPNYIRALTFSKDRKTLWVVGASQPGQQHLLHGWDIESGQQHTSITPPIESDEHKVLKSTFELHALSPPFFRTVALGDLDRLFRVNESDSTIDVVEGNVAGARFADDGSLIAALGYHGSSESSLVLREMENQSVIWRVPTLGVLHNISPDGHYLVMQKHQLNGASTLRTWLSDRMHPNPEVRSHGAREIFAIDVSDAASQLIGVMPKHHFTTFQQEGFIDGGRRVLIQNFIWEFPARRPWTLILLLPSLFVAILSGLVRRLRSA